MAIFLSILFIGTAGSGMFAGEQASGTRLSEMIKLDILNTYTSSDGVSGWGDFVVGRVNKTTTIVTRIMNNDDVPLKDVEVTCTVYWYDGFYPDRGAVMFKDIILVDVPPGDGQFSEMINYYWVPSFSGAYMINISAHVPGDAREMSTEPLFFQGIRYEPIPGSHFYSGVWVSSEYWDGSSIEGWEMNSSVAPAEEGWASVIHPLSSTISNSHSAPYCFWSGNRSTWNASVNGTHSLITPEIDLNRFDPEPYDIERSVRRPQIFLLYRYKGTLTPFGPNGEGSMMHYISIDNGSTWDPLFDIKDHQVNETGNTSGHIWDHSSRPFYVGNGEMVGIDIGAYQGERIKIRFDQTVSGYDETGYLLDDITIMGMDLVESEPFQIEQMNKEVPQVDPGSSVSFELKLSTKRTQEKLIVRFQCINATGTISPDEDVSMDPQVLRFDGNTTETNIVRVYLDIPENERSGSGSILIRAVGGGISRDLFFDFEVKPFHDLKTELIGDLGGSIDRSDPLDLDLFMINSGNIIENVYHAFVTPSDLIWTRSSERVALDPGESRSIEGELTVANGTISGKKIGFIVSSIIPLPGDDILLDRIISMDIGPSWIVHEFNFTVDQVHSIDIVPVNRYMEVTDPPDNGSLSLEYELFVLNNGNGMDQISFTYDGLDEIDGMKLILPEQIDIQPMSSMMVKAVIELEFPLPMGRYTFMITGISQRDGKLSDNSPELTLVIGSNPISSGTFLLNGSMQFQQGDVIMGMEVIITFSSLTFGIPDDDAFTVGLQVNDLEVKTGEFPYSIGEGNEHQLTYEFTGSGPHMVSLVLYENIGLEMSGLGLLTKLSMNVTVRKIDLHVSEIFVDGNRLTGEGDNIDPGTYPIEASIWNLGDIAANIVTVSLEVYDMDEMNRTVFHVNLTDVDVGRETVIAFKSIQLDPERDYRLTVSIYNNTRWKDNTENNDLSIVIQVGEIPPDEPIWRDRYLLLVGLGVTLLVSVVLFLYLVRKKL